MHGADEWVDVYNLRKTEEMLVNVIRTLCQ